jgi:hypothetical protein
MAMAVMSVYRGESENTASVIAIRATTGPDGPPNPRLQRFITPPPWTETYILLF